MKNVGKVSPVILLLVFLYAGIYLGGRFGGAGLVLDDTATAWTGEENNSVTLVLGGGFLPMGVGKFGTMRSGLNVAFFPMQEIDHAFTGKRFYWFFEV